MNKNVSPVPNSVLVRGSKKFTRSFVLIASILVAIAAVLWFWSRIDGPELHGPKETQERLRRTLNQNEKGESLLQGVVTDNFLGCEVDAHCFIRLQSNEFKFRVIYNKGDSPCHNDQAGDQGIKLEKGDKVEVFALYEGQLDLSTCSSNSYYIKKLN